MRRSSRQSSVAPHPRASRRERGSEASRQASAFSAWREADDGGASKCRYAYVNYVVKTLFVTNDYTLVSPSYRYRFFSFSSKYFALFSNSPRYCIASVDPTPSCLHVHVFFKKYLFRIHRMESISLITVSQKVRPFFYSSQTRNSRSNPTDPLP